jgi:hypothetical protein
MNFRKSSRLNKNFGIIDMIFLPPETVFTANVRAACDRNPHIGVAGIVVPLFVPHPAWVTAWHPESTRVTVA